METQLDRKERSGHVSAKIEGGKEDCKGVAVTSLCLIHYSNGAYNLQNSLVCLSISRIV